MLGKTTDLDVLEIFRDCGALLEGHFLLSSGRHSPTYFEKAQVLQFPAHVQHLCAELARRFRPELISVVVSPTTPGILLGYEMGRQLDRRAIFAEREEGKRVLRRGFHITEGEAVLVVDDIQTTGLSVREVMELVREQGGEVVGVALLVDRSNGAVDLGVRTEVLLKMDVVSWEPAECPLCKEGVPLEAPGSRHLSASHSGGPR
ncbi:MAG TPA: orotate phosphoribosyltransferase [Armatimonadota bacterium]|jgi:orotate phosphoribosyltransferase